MSTAIRASTEMKLHFALMDVNRKLSLHMHHFSLATNDWDGMHLVLIPQNKKKLSLELKPEFQECGRITHWGHYFSETCSHSTDWMHTAWTFPNRRRTSTVLANFYHPQWKPASHSHTPRLNQTQPCPGSKLLPLSSREVWDTLPGALV